MASVSVLNSIGTVVHNSPDKAVSVLSSFGTVVHNTPVNLDAVSVLSSFSTVVHNTPPVLQSVSVQNMFGTTVHDSTFVFNVSDITGTVSSPATFDASTQGLSTSSYSHEWTWVSVPGGSSFANEGIPFPDNSVNTYFNMTDNLALYHFEDISSVTPDDSGAGRNLQVNGGSADAGKIGQSILLNGSSDFLDFSAADVLPGSTNAISIAFWQYGGSGANNTIIWAENASSQRVINIHLPYGGQVYFDCGNSGGSYDRINKSVSAGDVTGQWNHWVFTKDVSAGEMKIYLNGFLFHSDTGKTRTLDTITSLYIGAEGGTTLFYDGRIDELAFWSSVLSEKEINDIIFLQSGAAASGSGTYPNLGQEFTFTPDVVGTYTMNINFHGASSVSGNVDAVISSAGPTPAPVITGSNPTVDLVEAGDTGYVLNTYRIQNLSVQRSRTSEQVPFKLGTKGRQSLRLNTNTEFTGSS